MALKRFSDNKKQELERWFKKTTNKIIEPIGINDRGFGIGFVFKFKNTEIETIIFKRDFSALLKKVAYNLKHNEYKIQ